MAKMQLDGNFVVHAAGAQIWDSGTIDDAPELDPKQLRFVPNQPSSRANERVWLTYLGSPLVKFNYVGHGMGGGFDGNHKSDRDKFLNALNMKLAAAPHTRISPCRPNTLSLSR